MSFEIILKIIQRTPLWVWTILGYLVFTGLRATKSRTAPAWSTLIMPTLLTIWSILTIYKYTAWHSLIMFALWALGWVLSGVTNSKHRLKNLTSHITIPGSYKPLLLSLSFFALKYSLNVSCTLNPEFKTMPIFFGIDLVASGLMAGISLKSALSQINSQPKNF